MSMEIYLQCKPSGSEASSFPAALIKQCLTPDLIKQLLEAIPSRVLPSIEAVGGLRKVRARSAEGWREVSRKQGQAETPQLRELAAGSRRVSPMRPRGRRACEDSRSEPARGPEADYEVEQEAWIMEMWNFLKAVGVDERLMAREAPGARRRVATWCARARRPVDQKTGVSGRGG